MDTSAPIVLGLIVDPSPRNVGAAYLPQRDETRFRTTADRLRGWRAWSRNIEGASEEYGPLPPNWFGTDHAPTVRITEETSAGAVKGQKCLHWGKGLCPEGEELRPFPLAKDPNTRGGTSYYA